MILHLLTDEKFTDYAISQFSAPELQSEFVLIPSNNAKWQVNQINKCTIIQQRSKEFEALLNRLDQYTGTIFHGMFWRNWQQPILERVPKHVKVAWVFWGGDIYGRHEMGERCLAPMTKMLNKLHGRKDHTEEWKLQTEMPLELFKRVDYCLTSVDEEYQFVKEFLQSDIQLLWYTYYSIEETIGALKDCQCEGNNVWIGNSAAIENNHVDVLWQLWKKARRSLKDRHIIIPLSYGNAWVRNMVKKVGRFLFGKQLRVLETFMPRDEYNKLMLSCSTFVSGHHQPAAQGNIITALWLGMRVYMNDQNLTYQFLKRIGATVFTIEKDFKTCGFKPLTAEERLHNRDVLSAWYSKAHMMEGVKEIAKELNSLKK